MTTFEPGDIVRCKDAGSWQRLTADEQYTVLRVGPSDFIHLEGDAGGGWASSRFELVSRAGQLTNEPPYWRPSVIDAKPALPSDSAARKGMPVASGVLHYFSRAVAYVAMISKVGNDKHNPGQPLQWSKDKSYDHLDCVARHLIDAGKRGESNMRETGYLAWRALAALECELEAAEARGETW